MKRLLMILFLLLTFSGISQEEIQVAKMYKTVMLFEDEIAETILGNNLEFIMEKQQGGQYDKKILKLTYNKLGKDEKETNLVVITANGEFFEFILKKVDKPTQLTYKIETQKGEQIFIQKPDEAPIAESPKSLYSTKQETIVDTSISEPEDNLATDELYQSNIQEYFRLKCFYQQFDKPYLARYFSKIGDLFLRLNGVYYNKNELYFTLVIDNAEPIDYNVNFIRYTISTNYKKSGSNQSTEISPKFIYKVPKTVKGGTKNVFMVVFDQFTLDRNKVLNIELNEANGNRNTTLTVSNKTINKPKRF